MFVPAWLITLFLLAFFGVSWRLIATKSAANEIYLRARESGAYCSLLIEKYEQAMRFFASDSYHEMAEDCRPSVDEMIADAADSAKKRTRGAVALMRLTQ